MNHGSLFSGIGGFDLASEWRGWNNVFHCEIEPFPRKILKYYWPDAISYEDITKTDFSKHSGTIDILTGGFPCQPYSSAGKRLGKEDDRHLWPEMLRAIREIQPSWVVGENVRGLTNWNGGLVFDEVQADLEAEGYEVTPFLLPACAVNAPHRRDRIWFVAYCTNSRTESLQSGRKNGIYKYEPSTNPGSEQLQERTPERNGPDQAQERTRLDNWTERSGNIGDVTNTSNEGLQRWKFNRTPNQKRQERREQPSGPATKLHKIENWKQFPTQSPVCSGNDGFPSGLDGITFPKWRNESIKAAGNAIVPQVAYQIFKCIEL